MTDRLKGCWVAFDRDIRTDDAAPLLQAIGMLKGVASVEGSVVSGEDWMNREAIRLDIRRRVIAATDKEGGV